MERRGEGKSGKEEEMKEGEKSHREERTGVRRGEGEYRWEGEDRTGVGKKGEEWRETKLKENLTWCHFHRPGKQFALHREPTSIKHCSIYKLT